MQKKSGFIVSIILILVAVYFILFIVGAFNQHNRPFGLLFKETLQLKCGLTVYSPKENKTVSFPLSVYGYVNGCGWTPDETGHIGTFDVVTTSGLILGRYNLEVSGDTTSAPYYFEGIITPELPQFTTDGMFIFTSHNATTPSVQIPVSF